MLTEAYQRIYANRRGHSQRGETIQGANQRLESRLIYNEGKLINETRPHKRSLSTKRDQSTHTQSELINKGRPVFNMCMKGKLINGKRQSLIYSYRRGAYQRGETIGGGGGGGLSTRGDKSNVYI